MKKSTINNCDDQPSQILFRCLFSILLQFPSPILQLIVDYTIAIIQGNFNRKWGSFGSNDSQFNAPFCIAVDNIFVYLTDQDNSRIQIFTHGGVFQRTFGKKGSGHGEFDEPSGIGVDDTCLYIADSNNKRVQVIDKENFTYARSWSTNDSPFALCLHESKIILSTDNDKLEIYDKTNGKLLQQFCCSGTDNEWTPEGVTCDGEKIYATDWENHRVRIFTMEGKFLSQWGTEGHHQGQLYHPNGITYGSGMIYIDSGNRNGLDCFTVNGQFQKRIMKKGSNSDDEISHYVYGMVMYANKLFVVDSYNHRIQVIE